MASTVQARLKELVEAAAKPGALVGAGRSRKRRYKRRRYSRKPSRKRRYSHKSRKGSRKYSRKRSRKGGWLGTIAAYALPAVLAKLMGKGHTGGRMCGGRRRKSSKRRATSYARRRLPPRVKSGPRKGQFRKRHGMKRRISKKRSHKRGRGLLWSC